MAPKFLAIAVFWGTIVLQGCVSETKHTLCAFLDSDAAYHKQLHDVTYERAPPNDDLANEAEGLGKILPDNKTIQCPVDKEFCYSLWLIDQGPGKNRTTMVKQGCWDHPEPETCRKSDCSSTQPPPVSSRPLVNETRFCCCMGNYCNVNVTDKYVPPPAGFGTVSPTTGHVGINSDPNYREKTIIIALVSVFSVAVIIVLLYLGYRLWLGSRQQPFHSVNYLQTPPSPTFQLDQLKLLSKIDSGRYGEVWLATLREMDVAVKVFHPNHRSYYHNEREIYLLPHMDHDTLPKFYGAEERIDPEGGFSYMIVMTYYANGTLSNYLRNYTIDWNTLYKMMFSCAQSLAHLHTDITKLDKVKPAIAHRDFNSRNILVKPDLTCVLLDFGFAMKISGSKYYRNGMEENAEQSSITDVGTLRYMAPEVLEGAVNLRDCEASLKQIDVYSLGLVLWEIASRCSDLYQGLPCPEYKLPFEAEAGLHPTFEEMQLLISRNKARPKFPDVWKDTNQAIRALKETIEDCWDQDAEARLTSLCVEERIQDMQTLWDSRHKGVTPTINTTSHLGPISDSGGMLRNPTTTNVPTANLFTLPGSDSADRNGNVANQYNVQPESNEITQANLPQRFSRSEHSMSASTTETTLTTSPDISETTQTLPSNKSNRNLNFAMANRVLQPHQGQNPTVERNTHKCSDEELTIIGNSLVDRSTAEAVAAQGNGDMRHSGRTLNITDELIDAIADNLESSLVQNDLLSQQQRQPMSSVNYHPNPVPSASQPLIVRPKQPNVPGNGFAHFPAQAAAAAQEPARGKAKKLKKPKEKSKLSSLFSRRPFTSHNESSSDESGPCPTENLREPGPAAQVTLLKQMGHQRSQSDGAPLCPAPINTVPKCNLQPRPHVPMPTEVCLMNGAAVVRPTSLPVSTCPPLQYNLDHPPPAAAAAGAVAPTRTSAQTLPKKVAGRRHPKPPAAPPVIMRQKSHSSADLSPTGCNGSEDFDIVNELAATAVPAPPSASNQGHWNNGTAPPPSDNNHNLIHKETNQSHRERDSQSAASNARIKRLKSPPSVKNGRLSLCDDRIMSQSASDVTAERPSRPAEPNSSNSSISMHQFGSVESGINQGRAADYQC